MSFSLCFTRRFQRLCNELKIPEDFLKNEIINTFKNIKKPLKAKRLYLDTHGNLKNSVYQSVCNLVCVVTYSIQDMPFCNRRKYFLRDVFHEIRHFQQDKIYGMDMDEYSMKDMTEGTKNYYNSKIELDARKFEKRSIAVYKRLRKRHG
ncbi:hypothetical protein EBR43_07905 [bacterium]|nr:hypothetical protein [bacterium]